MAIKKKTNVTGIKRKVSKKKVQHRSRSRKPENDQVTIFTSQRGHDGEWISVTGTKHMVDMPCHGEENDSIRFAVVLVEEPARTDHPHLSHEALYDYESGCLLGYMRVASGSSELKDAERIQVSLHQIAYDKGIDELCTECDRHPIINY